MGADCKYCGAYISGDQPKCPACGRRISAFGGNKNSGIDSEFQNSGSATQTASQGDWDNQEKERQTKWFDAQRQNQGDSFNRQRERQTESEAKRKEQDAQRQDTQNRERERKNAKRQAACEEYENANSGEAKKTPLSFLCYFGILLFVPLILDSKNEFVRYHSNQGLALFFTFIVAGLISWWILWLFVVYCFVTGLSNVSKGIMRPLPIIGKFKFFK